MNSKILAIVTVAIVATAGVGIYFFLESDGGGESITIGASLSVMGNANNDQTIDEKDLEVIEKIIANVDEFTLDNYPLADVNNDGKVDDSDVEAIKEMIERKNTVLNVVCGNADGSQYIQKIKYPISKTVVVGTNLLSTCIQVGASEFIKGYSSTGYGVSHKPVIDSAKNLGGTIFDLNTDDSLKAFGDLDAEVGGLDAVITMPSAAYLKTSKDYISSSGVPIVRMDSSDGFDSVGSALTLGYLYGTGTETIAKKYAEMSYKALDFIQKKTGCVVEKKTFMALTMGYYISEKKSAYTVVCEYSGGKTVSTLEGTGSSKIKEKDEFYMNWNPDFIVSFRTLDYSIDYEDIRSGKILTPGGTWAAYQKYFEKMGESYKNMVYINTSMPVVCRIAYIATMFYPDLFDEGYADDLHQSFVDEFMPFLKDFDVRKDMTNTITYKDVFGESA